MKLRRFLLTICLPFSRLIGKLRLAPRERLITFDDYNELEKLIQPGDVLLSRMRGECSNLFIPGFWTHAALYCGEHMLVEAIGKGTIETGLLHFTLTKDYVAVVRPKFPPFDTERGQAVQVAINIARSAVGSEYDYYFEPSFKAFYCSELVANCLNMLGTFKGEWLVFTEKTTLGMLTVTPQDFYNATKKFDRIFCSLEGKSDENV